MTATATLRATALATLKTSAPLSVRELAAILQQREDVVREVVWQLINRQEAELTRDWKLTAAQLEPE